MGKGIRGMPSGTKIGLLYSNQLVDCIAINWDSYKHSVTPVSSSTTLACRLLLSLSLSSTSLTSQAQLAHVLGLTLAQPGLSKRPLQAGTVDPF